MVYSELSNIHVYITHLYFGQRANNNNNNILKTNNPRSANQTVAETDVVILS